mmetsp:Transcript_30536/g.56576  ORF Transcript_30536/g.56576 Transcript_30536/m.56576 type:complete len:123 (-) Transcript_30536:306-674(-)
MLNVCVHFIHHLNKPRLLLFSFSFTDSSVLFIACHILPGSHNAMNRPYFIPIDREFPLLFDLTLHLPSEQALSHSAAFPCTTKKPQTNRHLLKTITNQFARSPYFFKCKNDVDPSVKAESHL